MIHPINHLPHVIPIGIQTESGVEAIGFDVKPWLDAFDNMTLSVWPTRPGEDAAYPAADIELIGNVLYWRPNGTDTAIEGNGRVEILGITGDKRKLSGWCSTMVKSTSLDTTQDPPETARPWVDQVINAAAEAKRQADRAEEIADDMSDGVVTGAVRYDREQSLTDEQKAIARKNIGADEVKNEPGENNVYIGSGPPPENAEVWIDPEGTVDDDDWPTASKTTKGLVRIGSGLTMAGEVLNAEVSKKDLEDLTPSFGEENAGKLVYIGQDGKMLPLEIGFGLEITDGVLRVTAAVTPEETVEFSQQEDGSVTVHGVDFVQQEDGSILWDGASFSETTDGSYLIS